MLIEVRVQLNGKTLREDIYKVATAIRVAKAGMRYAAQYITVFGPVWVRDTFGRVVGVKYRVSDIYPAGYASIWDKPVSRELEFADAQGSAVAA